MALIPGTENLSLNFAGYLSKIIYWAGITIASIASISVVYLIYHMSSFRLKATVFPLYGSGTDGVFSIGKPTSNRIKWVNKHTAWKSFWPLFNKKEREPFDSEFIYPGNRVYVFSLNDEWSPGRINVNVGEDKIRAEVNPVPHYIRNWQSLTHKKIAQEFMQQSFWEQNKTFIMTIICVLICCILCGVTVYFTYKFATGGVQQASSLSDAIRNFGTIAGK